MKKNSDIVYPACWEEIPSPCFVLEEQLLVKNLEILRDVRKRSGAKVICALKGYSFWQSFPLVSEYLDGATASSLHEARLAAEEMGGEVHSYAPVWRPQELDSVLDLSGHISFNSVAELERYGQQARSKGVSVGIRVNPEFSEVETDLYNPCAPGSRLGVTAAELPQSVDVDGLHFHALCEQNADSLAKVLEALEAKFAPWLEKVSWVNFGGGHHITRADYELDLLVSLVENFRKRWDVEVILEPGEAVGLGTGYLKTTVLDVVNNSGVATAMIDTSFAAHMPDTLEMPYRPRVRGAGRAGEKNWTCRLGGTTCLAGDYLEDYSFAKPLVAGDTLLLEDMIIYTMVKTTFFNGVYHPGIAIIDQKGEFRLLREFGYEEFRNRLG